LKSRFIILFFTIALSIGIFAQERETLDSVPNDSNFLFVENSRFETKTIVEDVEVNKWADFKPDPIRALWMGAIIPGYGQILNRKYWKLPIVYAGFLGCAYAITWNNSRYQTYKSAYRDIIDGNPNTNSHIEILPNGLTLETYPGGISTYTSNLQSQFEQSRRYRDLSVIATVAYYGITLIDAYVDAHLLNYDISPDLSLNVRPALLHNIDTGKNSYGMQLNIKLK
jgi:hypothetical protein